MKFKILLCVFINISNFCIGQINLTSGLQLYLPFNGNALDASGNGNNAIINGPVLTTDQYGNANSAYQFDGINDFMEIANNASINLGTGLSLVAKVYPTGFYNGTCQGNAIFQKGNTDFLPGWYTLRYSDQPYDNSCFNYSPNFENFNMHVQVLGSFPFGTSVGSAGAPPYIQQNNWYCVVATWDNDSIRLYINGVLTCKYFSPIPIGSNNDNLFIGKMNNPTFPYWLHGKLDELRIYNRAINQAEIDSLCSFNQSPPPNCISTNTIDITTGIDVNNNQLLFNSTANVMDPLWKISNPSVGYSGATGISLPNAYIAKMQGVSLPWMLYPATTVGTPPSFGNWLTAWPDAIQSTVLNNNTTPNYYEIYFDRTFTMCAADSIVIDVRFAADNYVDYIVLMDATSNLIIDTIDNGNATNTAIPAYLNSLSIAAPYYKYLPAGKYIMRCRAGNSPLSSIPNPFSFYLAGSIKSATNNSSLLTNFSDVSCTTSANCFTNNSSIGKVCQVYIPNAFTPNQDGDNDCFKPITNSIYTDYNFSIFNRWGEQVFTSKNPDGCWNGQYKNSPCEMGTYFYYLTGTINCGKIVQKGDVILVR
jgi:gliding motility-associated-like protein